MDFVHLHTHSHYSLLDGLPKIDELVFGAKDQGMSALALTDHGAMYGVIEFYQKAKAEGIKPIIGVEAYVARFGHNMKRAKIDEHPYHLVLIAKNNTGYQNLIKLTTAAHLKGFYYRPRIDFDLLREYSRGLICLTACLQGQIPRLIINNQIEEAEEAIKLYQDIFGQENFYLELQHHPHIEQQAVVNKKLIELAKKFNVPLVATNDIHYLKPEDDEAQDILLCIKTKKKLEDKDRISYIGEDFSMRSKEKMIEDFSDCKEAIKNTVKIADQCNLDLEFGKIILPHFEVPEEKNPDDYLKELCQKGLEKRYGKKYDKKIDERLEYELGVIKKTGFAPYFLIVQDFVNWAKNNGIVVGPGRGSAAGSIVAYLTNTTNVDPLKYDLLFERFLNPERISMPDIDMDFADTRRDEVIRYVEQKYGKDHVAQIITFGTMAARAAIRDVGRVLALTYSYCDRVAKLIPMNLSLEKSIETIPELREIYEGDPEGKRLLETAKKLEGVARHASTHACGIVITREPLDKYLPVQYAPQGEQTIITQYSLHPIEDLGLLKMDFLGLKNLTIVENTIYIIEKTEGIKIDIDKIPLDDKKTYQLLRDGQTTGVFQLESSGMRRYLRQLKPTEFEDIIAMVSLYRPGPMNWIPDYISGKHKTKETKYLHPKLKPILEKTHGVVIYQEQVMQIARDLAGFTLGEADVLRKAVGKKIPKLLKEQKSKFITGCVANKIAKETAEKIFDFIEPFAGYGFNRAHAACYAQIAYQTAYLKANHPKAFMASLLTSDQDDIDRVAIEVQESRGMGIQVLPPDINESFSTFTVVVDPETKKIFNHLRFGLLAIKNVGENISRKIIDERKENGPYKNLEDFLRRVQTKDLNKKSLESLIKSGALDKFGERNEMLSNIDQLLLYTKSVEKERTNHQSNLFGQLPTQNAPGLRLKKFEPASKKQKLAWEKELLGLYLSAHPMEDHYEIMKNITIPCRDLGNHMVAGRVRVGGIITQIQRVITRNNEAMLFVKIEDMTAALEVLVFPNMLKTNPTLWQEDKIILIEGKLTDKDGVIKIICDQAVEFNKDKIKNNLNKPNKIPPATNIKKIIYINLAGQKANQGVFNELKSILANYPGEYKVYLKINQFNSPSKLIATNFHIDHNKEIKEKIEEIVGQNSFIIK